MSKEYLRQPIIPVNAVDANLELYVEDFNNGKPSTKAGTGSDYEALLSPDAALRGPLGLNLKTKATTPASNDYVSYTQAYAMALSQYIELAVFVRFPSIATDLIFEITGSVQAQQNTDGLQFGARVVTSNENIDVLTGSATFTNIGTVTTIVANDWNVLQVGLDRITQKYVILRWNGEDLDPSAKACYDEGSADATVNFVLKLTTKGATQNQAYIDTLLARSAIA